MTQYRQSQVSLSDTPYVDLNPVRVKMSDSVKPQNIRLLMSAYYLAKKLVLLKKMKSH